MTLEGQCGEVSADVATSLAVALAELLQNSVDHAFDGQPGHVHVVLSRGTGNATVEVTDDGRGLPEGFTLDGASGLGLQIVRTMVESDLHGRIAMSSDGGTRVRMTVPVAEAPG